MAIWHVTPNNDLKEHEIENAECHCNPEVRVEENGDLLVIHNSYDGREFVEQLTQDENIGRN